MPVLGVPEQTKTRLIGPSVVNRSKMQCARKTAQRCSSPIPPSNVIALYRRFKSCAACPKGCWVLCATRGLRPCNCTTVTSSLRSSSKASDHACSWTGRSSEDFEQHHIEESERATQVILRVRFQTAASLLCLTDSCILIIKRMPFISQLHVSYNRRTLAGWHALPNL